LADALFNLEDQSSQLTKGVHLPKEDKLLGFVFFFFRVGPPLLLATGEQDQKQKKKKKKRGRRREINGYEKLTFFFDKKLPHNFGW
jgi:hypothetical protein